jgi:hypothetical protein
MDAERIDFISAYCDRWCERCAFTDRCSAFACQAAIAMCGDFAEGIQLAVGRPKSAGGNDEPPIGERLMAEVVNQMPTEAEMEEFAREGGCLTRARYTGKKATKTIRCRTTGTDPRKSR